MRGRVRPSERLEWLETLEPRTALSGSVDPPPGFPFGTSVQLRGNYTRGTLAVGKEKSCAEPLVASRSQHAPATPCNTAYIPLLSTCFSPNMSGIDEDSVDEILYLARANEASELDQFLTSLSTQVSKAKDQIIAQAIDSYSQNTALHYAAANGHIGTMHYRLRSRASN